MKIENDLVGNQFLLLLFIITLFLNMFSSQAQHQVCGAAILFVLLLGYKEKEEKWKQFSPNKVKYFRTTCSHVRSIFGVGADMAGFKYL